MTPQPQQPGQGQAELPSLEDATDLAKNHHLFNSFMSENVASRTWPFGEETNYHTMKDLIDFAAFCLKHGENAPFPIFEMVSACQEKR